MSVKRYEWVACDEHSCHCDVVESAEGDMVDYEDYAALEARCTALAAENAGLKAAGNKMFLSAISLMEDHELKIDHALDIKDWEKIKTTATDAFLDEVRAQGVEMFADSLGSPYVERGEECYQDGYTHAIERIKSHKALEFAAQIRKGVQS